jgi:TM2 domain-containing membrane protein YozV
MPEWRNSATDRTFSDALARPGFDPATRMMRYDAGKKSVGTAYLLWFFLGGLGVHRFYLGRWVSGLVILVCTTLAFVTFGLTAIISVAYAIWDLFTIPAKVQRHNEQLIASLA